MKTAYRSTPDARSDLIEIRRFTLQQWGPAQSLKYLSELRKTISLLSETPSPGKFRSELGVNVLSFPHASHVIYYVVHKHKLVVFGLLHRRIVPLNHLIEREKI
jgi:toxin ParE1/3/4